MRSGEVRESDTGLVEAFFGPVPADHREIPRCDLRLGLAPVTKSERCPQERLEQAGDVETTGDRTHLLSGLFGGSF